MLPLDAQAQQLGRLATASTPHTYHGGRRDDSASGSDGEDARAAEVREVRRIREALQPNEGRSPLPEGTAQRAMLDPLGVLMAATSVPLGISLRLDRQRAAASGVPLPKVLQDEPAEQQPEPAQPQQQQQGRRRQAPRTASTVGSEASAAAAASPLDARVAAAARLASDPARALEQLEHLIAAATANEHDSWGTTTQSAAEIAQRIAESNRGEGGAA